MKTIEIWKNNFITVEDSFVIDARARVSPESLNNMYKYYKEISIIYPEILPYLKSVTKIDKSNCKCTSIDKINIFIVDMIVNLGTENRDIYSLSHVFGEIFIDELVKQSKKYLNIKEMTELYKDLLPPKTCLDCD